MLFLYHHCSNESASLQAKASLHNKNYFQETKANKKDTKRVFWFSSSREASITVEAAFVVPIFLFFTFCIFDFFQLATFHSSLESTLFQVAKEVDYMLQIPTMQGEVERKMKEEGFQHIPVMGEWKGLHYQTPWIPKEDWVVVTVVYQPKFSLGFFPSLNLNFICTVKARMWTGYQSMRTVEGEEEEMLVYITETGTVFHEDQKCTHLDLKILPVESARIGGLRNQGGGKYYPCERCVEKAVEKTILITPFGDRYHNFVGCSGLKRTIQAVLRREVQNRKPCSRCATGGV